MKKLIKNLFDVQGLVNSAAQQPNPSEAPNHETHPSPTVPMIGDNVTPEPPSHHSIIADYEEDAMGHANKGILDGAKGEPHADQHHPSASEQAIIDGLTDATTKVGHHTKVQKHRLEQELVEAQEDLNHELDPKVQQTALNHAKDEAKHKAGKLNAQANWLSFLGLNQVQNHEMKLSHLEAKHHKWTEKKQDLDTLHQHHIHHHYHHLPPIRRLIDLGWVFKTLISLLLVVESFANFGAFSSVEMGDLNIVKLFLGLLLAILQGYSAISLGSSIQRKKWIATAIHLVLLITFCVLLGAFRWEVQGNILVKIAFAAMNLFIGAAMAMASHARAKHLDYFTVLKRRHKATAKVKKIAAKITKLKADHEAKVKKAMWQVEHNFHVLQQKNHHWKEAKIRQIKAQLAALESHNEHSLNRLKTIHDKAISHYRQLNQTTRLRSGHHPVKDWMDDSTPDTEKSHDGNGLSNLSKAICFLLIFALGLSSCSNDEMPVHLEIAYDVTGKNQAIEVEPMAHYVMEELGLHEEASHWPQVHVKVSQITHQSTPVTHSIHLPQSENYWFRNETEHRQHLANFQQHLYEKLALVTDASDEQEHSYIHRNLHHRLNHLAKQHGHKMLLSWSDLIHNHAPVNLYDFKHHEHEILTHKDSLIHLMTRGYELPNLQGIHVINHHHPSKAMDELHEAAKHLFHHHLTQKGAKVEFRTGMQHHPAAKQISSVTHPHENH